MGGATADQGRDIVGYRLERDVDGDRRLDRWFIQCKHHKRGVAPDKLQGAVTWAMAERPAVLLFVLSNFLSNPAKAWLEEYNQNNHPTFRIKIWERKKLEQFISTRPGLARKYGLQSVTPRDNVHPAHAHYVLHPPLNSMAFFLGILDDMDVGPRDELFEFAYFWVINPEFREPRPDDRTLADRMLGKTDYFAFRRKCQQLVEGQRLADFFLVQAIVSDALRWAWRQGDLDQLNQVLENIRDAMGRTEQKLREETDAVRRADLVAFRDFMERRLESAPGRQRKASDQYKLLCESILPVLYLEEPARWMDRGVQV